MRSTPINFAVAKYQNHLLFFDNSINATANIGNYLKGLISLLSLACVFIFLFQLDANAQNAFPATGNVVIGTASPTNLPTDQFQQLREIFFSN